MTPGELIQRHLDDVSSDAERADLDRLLAGHPEVAEAFAEAAREDGALAALFQEERAAAAEMARPRRSMAMRLGRFARTGSAAWVFWGTAAACGAALLAAAILSRRPDPGRPVQFPAPVAEAPIPPPLPEPPAPAPVKDPEKGPAPAPRIEAPPPAPIPATPATPEMPPAPPAPRETVAVPREEAGAELERVRGEVTVDSSGASAGHRLRAGQEVKTGRDGAAAFRYEDGTRIELGAESVLGFPEAGPGKALRLARGRLSADVARQPAGLPMILTPPQAEARVLGTRLTLAVTKDATRLEVREGKVRLTRLPDGVLVDVPGGHFAVAQKGLAMLARPVSEEPKTISFEVEEFGTARGVRPADGMVRRIFLEPMAGASGGTCVAVPGLNMEVAGDVSLARGTWHLWVRYRDEPGSARVAFSVHVGDQLLGQAAGPGRGLEWHWKRVSFPAAGATRITLRSAFRGVEAPANHRLYRQSPYAALNRWDRIVLTSEEGFTPE